MKLEVGKSYRTRDGKKVTIVSMDNYSSVWENVKNDLETIRAALTTQENRFLEHYNQGVSDTKKAISNKIEEMALYFDKWECYSGKYSSSSARESVTPEELGEIITELDVEPSFSITAPNVNADLLEALKECLPRIEEIRLVDLGAVRDAEMQDYNERKIITRRELAETNELVNKINVAIARAEQKVVK